MFLATRTPDAEAGIPAFAVEQNGAVPRRCSADGCTRTGPPLDGLARSARVDLRMRALMTPTALIGRSRPRVFEEQARE